VIVFHLLEQSQDNIGKQEATATGAPLDVLRRRAYEASSPAPQAGESLAKPKYYERSRAVRDYVLARADGVCESCGNPAPFIRASGDPYLEPHHIRRLTDGGPDHPRFVAAISPNCHREVHHGAGGATKNER
jgi:5-methylcytosine-specific restriction protein A